MSSSPRFRARPDVVVAELDGGSVLLDLTTSAYYSLNPVGLFLWRELEEPRAAGELQLAVRAAYDVDEAVCARDVDALLEALQARKLLLREPDAA
ncbi:PqqD family protein [Brevundimonas sp.]|uniref:PqqD family protein n=1 Tax=Brevundimonas sp. TaxID=1871086 RepID=UPI0035AFBC46